MVLTPYLQNVITANFVSLSVVCSFLWLFAVKHLTYYCIPVCFNLSQLNGINLDGGLNHKISGMSHAAI